MSRKLITTVEQPPTGQPPVNDDWGDAWGNDQRRPLPSIVTAWVGECRMRIRNALVSPEVQRQMILAGMAVRAVQPTDEDREAEIARRIARADQVRELAKHWQGADKAAGIQRSLEESVCRIRRLVYLSTLGLVPQPPDEAQQFAPMARRGRIDHDARMRQAEGAFDVQEVA